MKIGSFFMILLVALVALGYLFSDSLHLREDISNLQMENGRLTQALQQTEQAKQEVLVALQTTTQDLNSCQQTVNQSNQIIAQLTDENLSLKEENQQLASQQTSDISMSTLQPETKTLQATTIGLFTFLVLGVSAIMTIVKGYQKHTIRSGKTGQYIYLTDVEIKNLIRRRRETQKSHTPYSGR